MSDKLDSIFQYFPQSSRDRLSALWLTLPPDVRRDFQSTLSTLDGLLRDDPRALAQLTSLVTRHVRPLTEAVADIAIIGPVNVGKSSLYNALVTDPQQQAAVGPVPGTTRQVQTGDLGLVRIMDTPGAEHWADQDRSEINQAMAAARSCSFLMVVFDASRGILTSDRDLHQALSALNKPQIVVLNKIDLISQRSRSQVIAAAASALGLQPQQILPVSASSGHGVHRLILEVAVAEPRLLGYLGSLLPDMRRGLAWMVIRRCTITSTIIALAPLPFIDLLPLSVVQISMILTIARIYGQPTTLARAREVLGTFGVGLLARSLFYELIKLGGIPGWVIASSVAAAATIAIGYAAVRWFEKGEKLSREDLQKLLNAVQRRLLSRLRTMGRRKPAKEALTAELEQELAGITHELEEPSSPPEP